MTSRGLIAALRQALWLLGLSLLMAVAAQRIMPSRIPWQERWSHKVSDAAARTGVRVAELAEVQDIVRRQSHLLLDARPLSDYQAGHLPGAFPLPQTDIATHLPAVQPLLTPGQPLLVYCSGLACDESLELARLLRAQGMTNVVLFAGGIQAWQQAGLELQR